MKSNLLKQILIQYDEARLEEEVALRAREAEAMEKIPELAQLRYASISSLAKRARDLILKSNNGAGKESSQELDNKKDQQLNQEAIEKNKEKERKLLVANGFPEDYLTIRYRCQACKDTGFVGDLVKEKCNCLIQRLIQETCRQSDLSSLDEENFDTFDETVFPDLPLEDKGISQRDYMVQLKNIFINYTKDFPNNAKKNILFTGKTGLGKTFLLNCLAKEILDKGSTLLKMTSYNLFDQLFSSPVSSWDKSQHSLKDRIFSVDVLIVDDLGTETKRNNITNEDLFNILNERYLQKKHTFLSTNLSLKDLKNWYSDRVTSRLFDRDNTMIIGFSGQDIRLRPKK